MSKLFIIVNVDKFFLSHRKDIALRAMREGYDVTIVANDTGKGDEIRSMGLKFVDLPINKTGLNLLEEVKTFLFIYRLIGRERPDIVHLVGMKVILWGGLAARLRGVKGIVSAVSGLGVMFSPEYCRGVRKLMSKGVLSVMRYIHRRSGAYCIFHNTEDLDLFVSNGITDRAHCVRTMGSGIDLNRYVYKEEPVAGKIRVLFTARMVKDKGVLVLIEAAERLRAEYGDKAEFLLCGGLETNPLAVSRERLEQLCDGVYIQWLGRRNDVHELLEQSHIFAFPSYYKEGLPKSCIEATAVGRPVITCDSTGCRDTVIDGKTGFLVPVKDSMVLAEKLKVLFDDTSLRQEMGRNARSFAEEVFSLEDVIDAHLKIYKILI